MRNELHICGLFVTWFLTGSEWLSTRHKEGGATGRAGGDRQGAYRPADDCEDEDQGRSKEPSLPIDEPAARHAGDHLGVKIRGEGRGSDHAPGAARAMHGEGVERVVDMQNVQHKKGGGAQHQPAAATSAGTRTAPNF